ncbi:MAG: glycosyltransferase family 39 protein [Oscillospiraceae bacterium]|nr:glycosyltransferase family 39 protein [Oscillospiraceae bacterium]
MKIFKEFIYKHINISIAVIALLCIAASWIVPFQNKHIIIDLHVDKTYEGNLLSVEMYNPDAYEQTYRIDSIVKNGIISFRVDYDYINSQRISLISDVPIQNADKMLVYSSYFDDKDYLVAELIGDVLGDDGMQSLTAQALNTVQSGINNTNYLRMILTAAIAYICALIILVRVLTPKFGRFKVVLAAVVSLLSVIMLISFKLDGDSPAVLSLLSMSMPNSYLVVGTTAFFAALIITALFSSENTRTANRVIIVIYTAMLLFSSFRMLFYAEKVARTPDEAAHIGYVAYLEQTDCIVPDFAEMELASTVEETDENMVLKFSPGSLCYLGHPPLYYQLMKLSGTVDILDDGMIYADITGMRMFSMSFAFAAILLMFYIGYSRISKKPLLHLLYATVCTSVPMMLYGASGITNDTLTLLTVTVFVLGLLRYVENKKNFATYLLIAVGISATVMTKMTAGIMVILAGLIVFIGSMIKQKSFKELISRQFLLSVPVYLIPLAYCLMIYSTYGAFLVSIFKLNPEFARNTGFYVNVSSRPTMGIIEYSEYYKDRFFESWTGISSHIALLKTDSHWLSVQNFALISIWFIPLLLLIKKLRTNIHCSGMLLAGYAGILFTFFMQMDSAYSGFCTRGYMGGFQSRYYVCAICIFALAAAKLFEAAFEKLHSEERYSEWIRRILTVVTIAYTGLLAYEDFIYFTAYFNNYLD